MVLIGALKTDIITLLNIGIKQMKNATTIVGVL